MKRFSVLTATFGEGHNTAARNIRDALLASGGNHVAVEICDLYQRTNPRLNCGMQFGYSVAINRFPKLWAGIFRMLGTRGVLETALPTLGALREAMRTHFHEFHPSMIISTYPVYSFLVREIQKQSPFLRAPLVTVITDSTRINSAWYRCESDAFIVSDEITAEALRADGIPARKLHVLGFPVSSSFAEVRSLSEAETGPPHRVLYMPSTRRRRTIDCLSQLLRIPNVEITALTGRQNGVHQALARAGFADAPHVKLMAWTEKMPELMAGSHLFCGKAGGAIVQEAIAARTPFVVSHVVPGQEEGNIVLIEKLGIGRVASKSPEALAATVREAFSDDAALWKLWKRNLSLVSHPNASRDIAQFLLSYPV